LLAIICVVIILKIEYYTKYMYLIGSNQKKEIG